MPHSTSPPRAREGRRGRSAVRPAATSAAAGLLATLLVLAAAAQSELPPIRTLTEQEMVDMMIGSSIQASRSSDSAGMIRRVREAFAQGRTFRMISVQELPDDWTVVVPSTIGGGGAWEHVRERVAQQKLAAIDEPALKAVEALSRRLGKRFDAVVRVESSGGTLSAFTVASALGVPVVDACISGRAHPEVSQSITFINGITVAPAAAVTRWGDTLFLDRTVDDYRVEDLTRALAVASGGVLWAAGRVMTGRDVKRATIPGSLSDAVRYGRTVREAVAQGRDPIAALVNVTTGYKLFHGVVTRADGRGERGFTWWDVELRGIDEYAGRTYKIYVKNENIVTWLDGVPDAMSPDFIQNLDPKTGDAIAARELGGYTLGSEVVMVGWPASPMWRTPKGIEVFGPRHFGFDFDYVPIEQLQQRRSGPARR